MSPHRILICDEIVNEAVELLKSNNFEVVYKPEIAQNEVISEVKNVEGLIVRSRTKVTKEVLSSAPKLKIVARAGVGLDNVDVEEAKNRGIKVVNAPDSLTNAVAEHALGLMLSVARQIAFAHHLMLSGEWPKSKLMGEELTGKTLGIVGFGRIGRRLAQLVQPLRMRILTYDVVKPPDELLRSLQAELVGLETLLSSSDFISLHVPATPDTIKMIGEREINMMKRNAVIVNTSRGNVIDEDALISALKSKRIRGAALDVFSTEPPKSKELLSLDNVVLTPHIAGQTEEAQTAAGMSVAQQLIDFFRELDSSTS